MVRQCTLLIQIFNLVRLIVLRTLADARYPRVAVYLSGVRLCEPASGLVHRQTLYAR